MGWGGGLSLTANTGVMTKGDRMVGREDGEEEPESMELNDFVASESSLVILDILCHVLSGSTLLFFFVEPIHG